MRKATIPSDVDTPDDMDAVGRKDYRELYLEKKLELGLLPRTTFVIDQKFFAEFKD